MLRCKCLSAIHLAEDTTYKEARGRSSSITVTLFWRQRCFDILNVSVLIVDFLDYF